MPALLAHMSLIKEIVKENPKLFSPKDLKYLIQGATYPDTYYVTGVRTLTKKPNLSKFLHEKGEDLEFAKLLIKNAKNKQEHLFAVGFLSHMMFDKNVHNYLKKNKIYTDAKHMISEYYLETLFYNQKIPIPKFPIKLIKETLKEYSPKDYEIYKKRIKLSVKALMFYEFANRIIIKSIINGRYRKQNKKKISLVSIPFKLARIAKYKKIGYNYNDLLNPDLSIKYKHIDFLYEEYLKTKKELINVIMEKELKITNYTAKQTELRDFY